MRLIPVLLPSLATALVAPARPLTVTPARLAPLQAGAVADAEKLKVAPKLESPPVDSSGTLPKVNGGIVIGTRKLAVVTGASSGLGLYGALSLAKRGDYYRVKNKAGQEGWVLVDDTLAVYQMGDDKIRAKLDPLYNPDQYAKVSNASWLGTEDEPTAVFQVMLENTSDYDMENIVLSFVIKDSKGVELSRRQHVLKLCISQREKLRLNSLLALPLHTQPLPMCRCHL